jgi:hypothetical protein
MRRDLTDLETLAARNDVVEVEYRKVAARFEKYRSVETPESCAQMSAAMDLLKARIQRLELCEPDAQWKRGARADLNELLGMAAKRSVETGVWFQAHTTDVSEAIHAARTPAECAAVEKRLRVLFQKVKDAAQLGIPPTVENMRAPLEPSAAPLESRCEPDEAWKANARRTLDDYGRIAGRQGGAAVDAYAADEPEVARRIMHATTARDCAEVERRLEDLYGKVKTVPRATAPPSAPTPPSPGSIPNRAVAQVVERREACEPDESWKNGAELSLDELKRKAAAGGSAAWELFANSEPPIAQGIMHATTSRDCAEVDARIEALHQKLNRRPAGEE